MKKNKFYLRVDGLIVCACLFLFFSVRSFAQSSPITIDGIFDDWISGSTISESPDAFTGIDLLEMSVNNDEQFLYIRFKAASEFDLTDNLFPQRIRLYLDTDNNDSTGFQIQSGYGAELGIVFREHFAHYNVEPYSQVSFSDFSLRVAPTVSSDEFEIAIGRNAIPDATYPLFSSPTIKILLLNDINDDRLPDEGSVFSYTFDETPVPPLSPLEISKEDTSLIRILAYNTWANGLENPQRLPHFENIISILKPDIIGFSECGTTSPQYVKGLMDDWLPLGNVNGWYVEKLNGSDLITASKFPMVQSWQSLSRQFPVLIDLPDSYPTELLFTNAHLTCCGGDDTRQDEVDSYIQFILDAKSMGGIIDLLEGTPFVYGGDLNLVGYAQQLNTLLNGDIQNTTLYGPGALPDWDDTELVEMYAIQSDKRMVYTWRKDSGSYPPGKLDFIIYSDAVMNVEKSFVLQTEIMTEPRLQLYGLDQEDTGSASDHFPVISDISINSPVGLVEENLFASKVFPNPTIGNAKIILGEMANSSIMVFNTSGKNVLSIDEVSGNTMLDLSEFPSGVYSIKIIWEKRSEVHKLLKL